MKNRKLPYSIYAFNFLTIITSRFIIDNPPQPSKLNTGH